MKSSTFYAVIGLGILLVAGIIWWGVGHRAAQVMRSPAAATSSPQVVPQVGDSIYTNGTYGFAIIYPGSATVQTAFDTSYHLPGTWRFSALPTATGTPIVEIVGFKTKSDTSYPRYYEASVRIGASSDPKELAACYAAGSEEVALPSRAINGTVWHAFSFHDDGMQQYAQGISYRIIHDGACIALEQVATGSSYTDGTTSPHDIPETTLQQHYKDLDTIVASMTFAHA